MVIMIPGMILWCVENSRNFIPNSTSTPKAQGEECLRRLAEQSPEQGTEKRETGKTLPSGQLREC